MDLRHQQQAWLGETTVVVPFLLFGCQNDRTREVCAWGSTFDAKNNTVKTSEGIDVSYDYLIYPMSLADANSSSEHQLVIRTGDAHLVAQLLTAVAACGRVRPNTTEAAWEEKSASICVRLEADCCESGV